MLEPFLELMLDATDTALTAESNVISIIAARRSAENAGLTALARSGWVNRRWATPSRTS